MSSNVADEWTAAKKTMTCIVFDTAGKRWSTPETVSEVTSPARIPALRHLIVIDFDVRVWQEKISRGFKGQANGRRPQ
jgi:hypothetical protein